MRLFLEPRIQNSRIMRVASPLLAGVLTIILGGILFAALGREPLSSLYEFFISPISNLYGISTWLLKVAPLLLISMGLTIGFKANVWNIGAEGQYTMGAICGGGLALLFYGHGGWWLLPLMTLAGAAGGALWAAIPAFLKTRLNTNEILTSLLLVYVAQHLLQYLVHGPWRDPQGYNFPQTVMFDAAATFTPIVSGTMLNIATVASILVVPLAWVLMHRMFFGFQVKVSGLSERAADYAGYSRTRMVWCSMLLGGALSGMAGLFEVAGTIGKLQPVISPGYGFTAIIVAFLGQLEPVGVLLASLLVGLLYVGGDQVQISMHLPSAVAGVFQGLLLFLVLATDVLIRYRVRIVLRAPANLPAEG
ncbi:MAG TPA: ABC transporter permease [Burkholderiaceae bacterium]|nr:ABC transporter permease [Burkholderiaceae bacterium]